MNRTRPVSVLLCLTLALAACGSPGAGPEDATAGSSTTDRSPEPTASRPGIRLPAGDGTTLTQEPGSGEDALMLDAVYASVSDGSVVIGVAGPSEPTTTTDGFDSTATRLRIKEVLQGPDPGDDVTVLAGDARLALVEGATYLLPLSPSTTAPSPDAFTIGSAASLLERQADGTWRSRDRSVEATLGEVREVLTRSEEHLAQRRLAGEADLEVTIERRDRAFRATVSGYAAGASLGLRFCKVRAGSSVAPAPRDCDAELVETVTPASDTQDFDFTPPSEIRSSPGDVQPCDGQCALLVYDLDFPSRVFTTVPV